MLTVQPVLPTGSPAAASPPRFPVTGRVSYGPFHHDYPATDIFGRCGARVVAPADGVVLEVATRRRIATRRIGAVRWRLGGGAGNGSGR